MPVRVTPARALAVAGVLALGGCSGASHAAAADPDTTLAVSRSACGAAWTVPHGGWHTFQLHNVGTEGMEVALVDPGTGGIYASVEALAPRTTRPLRVLLGAARYAMRCVPDGADAVTGPTVRVTDGVPAPAVPPVTEEDLAGAVRAYRAYVQDGLGRLADASVALRTALHGNDLAAARTAWLSAHLAYERLGAAYGTFGDAAARIDGLPDGLPGGVHDPDFTGLYRIEYGLWHGEAAADLAGVADRLGADVDALRRDFPNQRTDPGDLPLRAHEILENTLQFQLTGAADQGSGTTLATADANLTGTRAVLDALAPVLASRYPGWADVGTWRDRFATALAAYHTATGWAPVGTLAPADRERLAGVLGRLLELLAPVAVIGEPRRTS